MNKEEFYSQQEIVSKYEKRRFGGKSGNYINKREVSFYLKCLEGFKGKILDMPIGTGRIARNLKNITGADSSINMLRKCEHLKIPLYQCDAGKTKFKDDEFDCVISSRFFHHFKDIDKFIIEMKRIVKPNGYILFDTFNWSPRMYCKNKVYRHDITNIKMLAFKYNLDILKIESMFLLPPLILKNLPFKIVKMLENLEEDIKDKNKIRHFFMTRNVK